DLPGLLKPEDVLVINDTKVLNARLVGQKETGAKVELLIERVLDKENSLVQLRSNSRLREGDKISLSESKEFVSLIKKRGDVWEVKFSQPAKKIIDSLGLVPLPPYLKRDADTLDVERYQTVYADPAKNYSVAAPTAGFHFDNELLDLVMDKGVNIAKITLHIGMGTFKPIKREIIMEHKMHKESIELKQKAIDLINGSKEKGGRVIAVGTTTLRCLESVSKMNKGALKPFTGYTDLFIYPGFKFNVVDALITNFHLPKSTLLLLVSAFGGYEKMREAYKYAIQEKYRFYSYGDSMFINANPD
ncbi:MAG: tRNA preQ1(34) S-adenosylmethionine ribosyltransferase-isomerase QueA, partial [SAR86 cluster bacterium]|nr:tRNA preQ1(34) S-adenosylmethionine ribosyltransferase-isomerase QueA [SAR86 cluster bacterium]